MITAFPPPVPLLPRYLLREFLRLFALCMLGFIQRRAGTDAPYLGIGTHGLEV